jgi:hypothetical protein
MTTQTGTWLEYALLDVFAESYWEGVVAGEK